MNAIFHRRLAPTVGAPMLAVLLCWTPLAPALAQTVGGNVLSGVDAQRQARVLDRDADRARAQDAAREVERLRAQLVALGRAESAGERTVGGARGQLRRVSLEEAGLKVRMGRNQDELTHLLGALQMYQRNPPPPLLVDPRSARDAVRATILIKAITPELEDRSRAFTAQAEQLKAMRRRADEASGALFQAQSDVADRQARIEDLIEQKRALEKQLYADANTADGDVRRLAARARSLGEFVGDLDGRKPARSQQGQSRELQSPEAQSQEPPFQASGDLPGNLVAPVQGELTRRFREKGPEPLRNKGWTWISDPSAAVLSPAAARVDYAGPLKGWGLVLILRVGEYHLVLAGLGVVNTDTGRTVAAGEPVGRMPQGGAGGASGASPRPELYLEVRRAAGPVDPARWFAARSASAAKGLS